jgi:cell surface protein SprA
MKTGSSMSVCRIVRAFRIPPIVLLVLLFWTALAEAKVGFRVSLCDSSFSNPMIQPRVHGLSAFGRRAILPLPTYRMSKITVDLGASKVVIVDRYESTTTTQVQGQQVKESLNLRQPTILDFATYAQQRADADIKKAMLDARLKNYKAAGRKGSGEGIAIDLPYRIKSKTFRRLFGGDNVGVRVQGNITINGSLRNQKFDEIQQANQRNTNTSFRIDMVQRFTITGKVGQKVEVKVDQDSERLFDFENSLKLTYTGDEDEIVQKVEAGNVALNLGTHLATFSGKNTGLFGLKTDLKVGALKLTGIASLERGQKNRQTYGNRGDQVNAFDEKNYVKNIYFWLTNSDVCWLDTNHTQFKTIFDYRENYRHYTSGRSHISVPDSFQIRDIEVFVESSARSGSAGTSDIWAKAATMQFYADLSRPNAEFNTFADKNHKKGMWQRLDKSTQYEVNKLMGTIRLTQPASGMLAVAFTTMNGDTFGSLNATVDSAALVLLKPDNPSPSDTNTWNLMFRHVYSLSTGGIDPTTFKLTIERKAGSQGGRQETSPPGSNDTYLKYFELDLTSQGGSVGADNFVDDLPAIVRREPGELHFLDLTPFNPSGIFVNGQPDTVGNLWQLSRTHTDTSQNDLFRSPFLYDEQESSYQSKANNWLFHTESRGSTSDYNLGVLVLEGSEEVTLNGQKLQKGADYTIDYGSGQLHILNANAKAPGAQLDITYESGRVFQLDKTTLLGTRAEYGLWDDQSYIGGMWLYLNQKTLDRRVRLGQEPIRNNLWDIDTKMNFTPNFLTKVVDAIPLVHATQGSQITLSGEVAKVFPDPNSLENPRTGDYNGLAYVDDFEGSRRSIPLGMSRRMWTISSMPSDDRIIHRRGRMNWWNPNPNSQVHVKDVFPERDVNQNVANTLQSIKIKYTPDTTLSTPDSVRRSWGGILRYLGEGYSDQTKSQYLEFWVKLPPEDGGQLIVDLGQISEDALPNNRMDSEDLPLANQDTSIATREYGNGVCEPREDTGIDHQDLDDPQDTGPWNGLDQPNVPSYDDWSHGSGSDDFVHINGTENNKNDENGGYPDTEDLNNNNDLDIQNSYFSYTIDLNDHNPFIVGGNFHNRWRLFRIPIDTNDPRVRRTVGNADLANVRWARLIMTGVTRPTEIEMVQMDIVSNEWLAMTSPTDSTEYVSTAVINSHENPGYKSPPGVEGEEDPITKVRLREQSLVLKINNLDTVASTPAPQQFFVAKNLYQETNLLEYKRMKMFVHGGDSLGAAHFPDSSFQVILRLGQTINDINGNYYEIITTVSPGWDVHNFIDIALNDLSKLQVERGVVSGRYARATDPNLPGDSIAIFGSPSLARVGFLAVGVRFMPGHKFYNRGASGYEIWVDELRLTDIYKDPGMASEVNATVKLSDFADFSGGYRQTDANFHNVNTRINPQLSSTNALLGNVNLQLHKFAIEQWGFRLPLSMSYNQSESTPLIMPSTDARIDPKDAPDSIKTLTNQFQYRLAYSKSGNAKNPLVRWTLEKLTASWDYTQDQSSSYNVEKAHNEQGGLNVAYTFPTAKGKGIVPLWFIKRTPVVGSLGSMRFYYKPTKLAVSGQATKRNTYSATRPIYSLLYQNTDSARVSRNQTITGARTFNTTRTLSTGFSFFDPLSVDFTRTHRGYLDKGDWMNLLRYDWGHTNDISQNVTNTYSPEIASWLRPSITYTSSYAWRDAGTTQGQTSSNESISNQRNIGTDLTLDFRSIFGGGGADRQRSGGERHETATPADTSKAPGDTTKKAERKPGINPFKALGQALTPIGKVLTSLDPVALSYDNGTNHSQSGTIGEPGLAYQLGFTQSPGVPLAQNINSVPTRSQTQNYTARSGMRLPLNIRSSFTYNLRNTENIGSLTTGSTDQNVFWMGSDKKSPMVIPFVDVNLDWSGLEQYKLFSKIAKTVSLSTGLTNKVTEQWSGSASNITSRSYTRGWNPLLGVNISWKGDIESQVRLNVTNSFSRPQSGNRERSGDQQVSATVSYTFHTGFKIPLYFMRPIHLQNQTTISMTGDYRSQKSERTENTDQGNGSLAYSTTQAQSSWSIRPQLTYTFSNTVQGQAFLGMQQTKNDMNGNKSRVFEFGIQVNISIRG